MFNIFDAPGKKEYLQSTIEGAAIADSAILVLSAKKCQLKSILEEFEYQQQIHE